MLCTKFNYRICACQAPQRGGVTSLVPAIFTKKRAHENIYELVDANAPNVSENGCLVDKILTIRKLVQRQARYQVYERRPSAGELGGIYIYACKMVSCFYLYVTRNKRRDFVRLCQNDLSTAEQFNFCPELQCRPTCAGAFQIYKYVLNAEVHM